MPLPSTVADILPNLFPSKIHLSSGLRSMTAPGYLGVPMSRMMQSPVSLMIRFVVFRMSFLLVNCRNIVSSGRMSSAKHSEDRRAALAIDGHADSNPDSDCDTDPYPDVDVARQQLRIYPVPRHHCDPDTDIDLDPFGYPDSYPDDDLKSESDDHIDDDPDLDPDTHQHPDPDPDIRPDIDPDTDPDPDPDVDIDFDPDPHPDLYLEFQSDPD
jgi:hypothetical protein